jgi:hypothetical protein
VRARLPCTTGLHVIFCLATNVSFETDYLADHDPVLFTAARVATETAKDPLVTPPGRPTPAATREPAIPRRDTSRGETTHVPSQRPSFAWTFAFPDCCDA